MHDGEKRERGTKERHIDSIWKGKQVERCTPKTSALHLTSNSWTPLTHHVKRPNYAPCFDQIPLINAPANKHASWQKLPKMITCNPLMWVLLPRARQTGKGEWRQRELRLWELFHERTGERALRWALQFSRRIDSPRGDAAAMKLQERALKVCSVYLNWDDFSLGSCLQDWLLKWSSIFRRRRRRRSIFLLHFWGLGALLGWACAAQCWARLALLSLERAATVAVQDVLVDNKRARLVYVKITWQQGGVVHEMLVQFLQGILQFQYIPQHRVLQQACQQLQVRLDLRSHSIAPFVAGGDSLLNPFQESQSSLGIWNNVNTRHILIMSCNHACMSHSLSSPEVTGIPTTSSYRAAIHLAETLENA